MDIQKHTGIYATSGDVRTAVDSGVLHNPYIAIVQDGNYLDWNGGSSPTPPEPVYSAMPLTFEIISGGTFFWHTNNETKFQNTIEVSLDNGSTWSNLVPTVYPNTANTLSVSSGDKIMFRGDNPCYYSGNSYCFFSKPTNLGAPVINVYGNIMSLINSTGYTTAKSFTNISVFNQFFVGGSGTKIVSAENLILPATALTNGCYSNMFSGQQYLEKAPELPAATLKRVCYQQMFVNCSSLNYIKCLATDISAVGCVGKWVQNVSQTGTFVKNPAMNDWPTGNSGIPNGWTVIDAE